MLYIIVRTGFNGCKFCLSWDQLTSLLHGHYFLTLQYRDEVGGEAQEVEDQANDEVD